MVLGKKGLRLEAYKFLVYISIPVMASVYFNDPKKQQYWADYFQFLKYPANPNTNLKGQFEEFLEQKEKEKEQRNEYAQQMRKLMESAEKSRQQREELMEHEDTNRKKGWMIARWLGFKKTQE
jgi:response regulator RpfG family c-di-GMP phosphodiesterase